MKTAITQIEFLKQRIIEKVVETNDEYLLRAIDKMLNYTTHVGVRPQDSVELKAVEGSSG